MKKHAKKIVVALLVIAMLVPTVAMIFTSAADNSYPVELAYNNIFVFEKWANNKLSTTMQVSTATGISTEGATLETNIEEGSFRFTKTDMNAVEAFTAYSADTQNPDGNKNHYSMDVKPNTTYTFSYYVTGNIYVFTPYIFMYNDEGLYVDPPIPFPTPKYEDNSFTFSTPENVTKIQLRFTIGDNKTTGNTAATSVYADVKDISICELEYVYSENLFDFSGWANSEQSPKPETALGLYNIGTVTTNSAEKSVTLATNTSSSLLFTNFTMSGTAIDNSAYYTIPVSANKSYTLAYSVVDPVNIPGGAIFAQPYVAYYKEDGTFLTFHNYQTPGYGKNYFTFTTPADTAYIMVIFTLHTASSVSSVTYKNIGVYESVTTVSHKISLHRQVFEYDHSAPDVYGSLPTANAPEGYVFGGWYTADGERITAETKIKLESLSVFAKYERAVDSLAIATPANKLTYTKGEKFNPAGLTLRATSGSSSFIINSDIYCTPAYLDTVGTRTITAHYGGQTVTFNVTVLEKDQASVYINGTAKTVDVVNNVYALNASVDNFNYYTIGYYSNAYVKGVITFETGAEEFFLEPSNNGSFSSLIDSYLDRASHNKIQAISFTCLDNELGTFQLKDIKTEYRTVPNSSILTKSDNKHELGVDLKYGGVVTDLYSLNQSDPVTARVYKTNFDDKTGNGLISKTLTKVDYKSKLNNLNLSAENLTYDNQESTKVNLINTLDRGRYLQQSYYGTDQRPYVQGEFNRSPWKYNPVQGGNVGEEPSKVIDYQVTDTYIYVKTRAMQWEKWSDDHVAECTHYEDIVNPDGTTYRKKMHDECLYGDHDAVVSDTYMEAWYTFENGMIKVTNRKVDYSGLPEATTQQEMPALYLIEPLNHFVYNDVSEAWTSNNNFQKEEEPEFWGIVQDYHEFHYVTRDAEGNITKVTNDENGDNWYDLYVKPKEQWAAFAATNDADSFGVGIYSEEAEQFYYGVMPQKYSEWQTSPGVFEQTKYLNYRHAENLDPSPELPTSYIAPLAQKTFKSYDPTEYTYYLATGTVTEIDAKFNTINSTIAETELAKPKIAVPETVYLKPTDNGTSEDPTDDIATDGQYYVNNILDENDFYNVKVVADAGSSMYFGLHVKDAVSFKVNVTNVTDPTNDVLFVDENGTSQENIAIHPTHNISTHIDESGLALKLSKGIVANTTVTAKWEITVTLSSGATETYTAYTVLYAPMRTVGAVAEARQESDTHSEISSWITGANGVDHQSFSPLGQWKGDIHDSGYFIFDPLYRDVPPENYGESENSHDYIYTPYPNDKRNLDTRDDKSEDAYVVQAATDGHDSSRAQSYLGLLTVDSSRYTNTNQIPNFKVGFDFLRVASAPKDSSRGYTTYYTLGDDSSFTAGVTDNGDNMGDKPSGWDKTVSDYGRGEVLPVPRRETETPSYDVSEINGKYIHALGWVYIMPTGFGVNQDKKWATAGTSVLCSVTDKSDLRDAVLNGYVQADKTDDADFLEKLENAATILGTPSATQAQIDEATKSLTEVAEALFYSLKYDNLFSAYEYSQYSGSMSVCEDLGTVSYSNGTITVVNSDLESGKTEAYTNYSSSNNYYLISVKPNTEYVFEYDVTTTVNSQAFVFFYDSNGANGSVASNITVQTDNGSWNAKTEANPWIGNYQNGAGSKHYAIKFTTGANTAQVGFRFGNTSSSATTSTFSNIKLVDSAHYYEDAVYTKTEDVYKEYTEYGTLQTPTRTGFEFKKWNYANGSAVATTDLATANTTIYSEWREYTYKIVYNANGGTAPETATVTYTQAVVLPGCTYDGFTFLGWATTPNATEPQYNSGDSVSKLTATDNGTVTLYAVWQALDLLDADVVVVDFSTPIVISPTDNDTALKNATSTFSIAGIAADETSNPAATLSGEYGSFEVSGNSITYTPTKVMNGVETLYYYVSATLNGSVSTYKEIITVAPASNVLYEETFFENSTAVSGKDWSDSKVSTGGLSSSTTANQDSSPIKDEIYGYDSNAQGYNKISKYSNGTAKTVTVNEDNRASKNITFTFTGTGFDLNSACGADTGVMIVSLRNNKDNSIVKSYVVDTYYGDASYGTLTGSNTLYQVPVISERNLVSNSYTVQVVASYLPSMSGAVKAYNKAQQEQQNLETGAVSATVATVADNDVLREALAEIGMDYILDAAEVEVIWFDDNSVLNGGEGANTPVAGDTLETASIDLFNVIDSVRVYEPLDDDSYYINSEKNATYYNVIDNLLKTEGSSLTNSSFFAYITGKLGVDENDDPIQLTVSNYNSVGPKDELYLAESTEAVAFKINDFATIKSLDGKVMISLRAASGTPNFKIGGTKFYVKSNTAMYYDITDYIGDDGTVTIQTSPAFDGDKTLLAIGDLKITDPTNAVTASLSSDVDLMTVRAMMMAEAVEVEPNTTPTPEEPEIPEDTTEPEDPDGTEEPAKECWLLKIFRWIFRTSVKIFNIFKGFLGI